MLIKIQNGSQNCMIAGRRCNRACTSERYTLRWHAVGEQNPLLSALRVRELHTERTA